MTARRKAFFFYFLICFSIAFFLRTYEISIRPLHSDEGVNYFFLKQVSEKGYYPYSHENYHGPSFFYSAYLGINLIGHNDLGLRSASIFYGMLCIFLLLAFLKDKKTRIFAVLSSFLFASSSSLVFHSRYAIHETLFVFSTLWVFLHLYFWLKTHRSLHLYGLACALASIVATKETFVVNLFCLFCAVLFAGRWSLHFKGLMQQGRELQKAFMLFSFLVLGIFTAGFRWFAGAREMFMAVQQWVGRGTKSDVGHFKPFLYYTKDVIFKAEPYLLFALLFSLGFVLFLVVVFGFSALMARQIRAQNLSLSNTSGPGLGMSLSRFDEVAFSDNFLLLRMLSAWSASICLFYSAIPYKTVWLVINLTMPLLLLLAALLAEAYCFSTQRSENKLGSYQPASKVCGALLLAAFALSSLFYVYLYNFVFTYGEKNPYSYVHTSPGMLELCADIEKYWREENPEASVLIGVNSYWPLPYYLRARTKGIGYLKTEEPEKYVGEYQVMILDKTVNWEKPGWRKQYYRLSEVQEAHVYYQYYPEHKK